PGEGPKVQVIKNIPAASFADYERRVRGALLFWCQHVEIELLYQGERIDKPLAFGAPGLLELQETTPLGTICVAMCSEPEASYAGFYNRGLTLLARKSEWPGVSYKINSSRLAHTLSRDQLVQDEAYYKLMGRAEALGEALR